MSDKAKELGGLLEDGDDTAPVGGKSDTGSGDAAGVELTEAELAQQAAKFAQCGAPGDADFGDILDPDLEATEAAAGLTFEAEDSGPYPVTPMAPFSPRYGDARLSEVLANASDVPWGKSVDHNLKSVVTEALTALDAAVGDVIQAAPREEIDLNFRANQLQRLCDEADERGAGLDPRIVIKVLIPNLFVLNESPQDELPPITPRLYAVLCERIGFQLTRAHDVSSPLAQRIMELLPPYITSVGGVEVNATPQA